MSATGVALDYSEGFRPAPTRLDALDRALEDLAANSQRWVDLSLPERIALVEEIHQAFPSVWHRWSSLAVAAKGIAGRKTGNDREWLELATICRIHSVVLRSLKEIQRTGRPRVRGGYRMLPNRQVAARVYPDSLAHGLAFLGSSVDVWLEPGVSLDEARARQAEAYQDTDRKGKIALVLGAGNASSLPSSDAFHKLFHDLRVVILKMNPVNSYLGPLLEEAYKALIEQGFLRIVYGGVEEGSYLVNHERVDEVHMTGSDRTYEAIVFGTGEEGKRRKAAGRPILDKPVDGELGCITPWVIVPGEWSQADVREQAAKMAFWMMRNEGYLCFSPRIVVLHREWPLREPFLEALSHALSQVEPIKAYYPGSAETQMTFVDAHPDAIQIGGTLEGHIPWTVIPNLDPSVTDDICFRRESFSGMCGEVTLSAPSVREFLDQAVSFLNQTVWGTLSATLVVSGKSLADRSIGAAVEKAIESLRYGTVTLNAPGAWGFYNMLSPWGGYPGSEITDIQSGTGKVGNYLMLHRPQKAVVRVPFRMRPYPFLGTAKNLDVFCMRLAQFETEIGYSKLPGLLWSALRS